MFRDCKISAYDNRYSNSFPFVFTLGGFAYVSRGIVSNTILCVIFR